MSVRTGCPHCGAELKLKSGKSVGRKVPCPKCGTPFVVKVMNEPAAQEEWDDYGDDYSDQDYGSSYDDYDQGTSSSRLSSGKRSSGSKRASSSRSKSRKSKKKSANTDPNWVLYGGVIAGVLMLVGGVVAFWPSGEPDAAATSGGQQPSGPVTVGPYVSFLQDHLRLQQPSGFKVVNPPDKIVQGWDMFAGFGDRNDPVHITITRNGSPVERSAETYTPEFPTGSIVKIVSRTVRTIGGKTDILSSAEVQLKTGRFFRWTRLRGNEWGTTTVRARMPFDEQATYSEPFKQILENAQFGPPGSNEEEEIVPDTESKVSLSETEVDGISLVPKKFLDGRIEMLVPASFAPMSEEMAKLKYPTANRPSEILTNDAGSVNLSFTYSKQVVAPNQLGEMHQSMDRLFRTIHKTAEWHNSGLKTINNRQWFEMDLTIQLPDTQVRNMMYGTSSGRRAAFVAFNVTVEEESQWAEAAKVMIASLHAVD